MRADLQGRLDRLVAEHEIAGAALAVASDGEVAEFASGVADVRTGTPMTPRHVCFVGSSSKVLTATLVMQLVDERLVALDSPVTSLLPGLDVSREITVGQLLSHSSGLANGPYADHGRGDDAVDRYVKGLGSRHVVAPAGERWGYSNAGYVIAGRVVEVVRGVAWDTALRRHLLEPAGLAESATLPEDALLHPVSVPHLRDDDDRLRVAPRWGLAGRSMGPTGSTLVMTAGDLLRFGLLHLDGGLTKDGTRVLSAEATKLMMEPQIAVTPGSPFAQEWGLGWYAGQWGDQRFRGHSGHNLGAGSHLALFPDVAGGLALVFNSVPGDAGLHHGLFTHLADELFGATKPTPWLPVTPLPPEVVGRYSGRFEAPDLALEVVAVGDELEVSGAIGKMQQPVRRMRPVLDGAAWGTGGLTAHAAAAPEQQLTPEIFFSAPDEHGRPRFAHLSVFLAPRVLVTPGAS
jgi:CubicO group peptidase (beta-lactamase class C family)